MKITKKNKIKINGYDVLVYKTDLYTSIFLDFKFAIPYSKENIFKAEVLASYMRHITKNYPTRKSLIDRSMELYGIKGYCYSYPNKDNIILEMEFELVDPKLVDDDYLDEAFAYIYERVMNPCFIDGHLNNEEIARVKECLITEYADSLLNQNTKSYNSFLQTAYPNSYLTDDMLKDKDECIEVYNSITDRDIIDLYNEMIKKNFYGVCICGNVDDRYLDYIEKLFKFSSTVKKVKAHKKYLPIKRTEGLFIEVQDDEFINSILRNVYYCPTHNKKDKMIYSTIEEMLCSRGRILHKILRDELKLVYTTSAYFNWSLKIMSLKAELKGESYEKALEGMSKALEELKKREVIEPLLKQIGESYELNIYTFYEDKYNVHGSLYSKLENGNTLSNTIEERYKIFKTITADDIIDGINKMVPVKIHLYRGGKDEN